MQTEALRKYSTALGAWSEDTSEASSYLSAHVRLEWSDAMMFQPVVQVSDQVVAAAEAALARIKTVTEASGLELRAASLDYDGTDLSVSRDLDATYEAVRTAPGDDYGHNADPAPDTVPEEG